MANTYTPYYNLLKPEVGSDTNAWGVHINGDLDTIDSTMNANAVAAAAAQATASAAVPKAGGTMTGALVIPANGLTVGTTQLVVSGGNVSMSGQLAVTGNLSTSGTITSSGAVTFGGNITNTGTLSTSGNGSFGGTLSVTGAVTLSSSLSSASLTTGNITSSGSITLPGSLQISNTAPTILMNDTNYGQFSIHCNDGNIGFLTTAGGWASRTDNSGNFTASGNVTAYSDAKLKEDVKTIEEATNYIRKMRGVWYRRIDDGSAGTGVIAQEVQKVIPELVHDNDGTLSVAYGNFAGVFIEALKELDARIKKLETK